MRFSFLVLCGAFLGAVFAPAGAAELLSLAEAQRLALLNAPQIAAQSAALRAAQQMSLGAGELPDPKLIIAIENVPAEGPDRYSLTADGMTMRRIGFMQEFTRGDKLRLRGERADAEVRKETAILALTEINLKRDATLAWFEGYFAQRQLALLKDLVQETDLQIAAAQAALAGGKGQAAEPFAARLAAAQLADRITDAERLAARARSNLARWIGAAAERPLAEAPAFDVLTHRHADLTGDLESHPNLAMYAPLQAMAESDARLADAAKKPDWSLEVAYQQRGPEFVNMFSIGVRIDLPIFQSRRQDPALASKLAAAEQARAQAEDAKRAHAAEIANMLADWEAAKTRVQRYEATLLPLARERSGVTLAAYGGGRGDLMPVIEARKGEIEMRMNHLQAQGELARAWTNLNSMLAEPKEKP
jgi:outer membrane protein TolC